MKHQFAKILILHEQATIVDQIKQIVTEENPQVVFLVADTKTLFLERLEWMHLDMIISGNQVVDISGKDAQDHAKKIVPLTPFILIKGATDGKEAMDFDTPIITENYVVLDEVEQFKKIFAEVVEANASNITKQKRSWTKLYQVKVLLNKSMELLRNEGESSLVPTVLETLSEIQSILSPEAVIIPVAIKE